MARQQDAVFATLVMTDSYLPGAMVLGHSLRDRGAKAKLAVLVLMNRLSPDTIKELQTVYDDIVPVGQISNSAPANLYLMNRPDLISTFTKIELWKQVQYKKIVYLDADMVILKAPNELLSMDTHFAAVPDVGWPDCFNSGMMVLNPNMGDYYALSALADRGVSFDGADQGLLNMHFTDWDRLSFIYNCTPNGSYQYVPAYRHFSSSIKAVHFIGKDKPWTLGRANKNNHGVYGELLARWWAVYDRHYRRPKVVVYPGQPIQQSRGVNSYVRGEETVYEHAPSYTSTKNRSSIQSPLALRSQPQLSEALDRSNGTRQIPSEPPAADDQQPQTQQQTDQPIQQQRRFSAPHAEWEPARQPPPTNSKPEAANFPTQQYEFTQTKELFAPPTNYPEPPKDMWYDVPQKSTQQSQLKSIFPWEEYAPRATRVFPKSRESTPPLQQQEEAPSSLENLRGSVSSNPIASPTRGRSEFMSPPSQDVQSSQPAPPPKPPSPPRHIFPWEARAGKATRVFPVEKPPSPPPVLIRRSIDSQAAGSDTSENNSVSSATTTSKPVTPPEPPPTTWDTFQQRSNAWDDVPEINKYMEGLHKPRKAKIQVLHHTPTSPGATGPEPLPVNERRASLKLTDFPTEIERPSLPVTPAPIRRPSFWGTDKDDSGPLPVAEGVPAQEEWVRRFSSYPSPHFPSSSAINLKQLHVNTHDGLLVLECQHCGKQNPVMKLEELQKRQSQILEDPKTLIENKPKTPPSRQMPDSSSREEAIAAALNALVASRQKSNKPYAKSILKGSTFESSDASEEQLATSSLSSLRVTPSTTATGTKSPTRFNPIILEGEAASERTSPEEKRLLTEEDIA